ncbi:MAG: lamin tail domain-containing protein, partial [Flavobacteriales bacterium]|nr:lamin tail domain-containing protein [Flavobacteriales bacterium]
MKKILLLTFTFLISINAYTQAGLLAGTGYAPNFTVTDINGTSHTIYDYLDSGYVMVLELMSVSCGHCINHAAGTENSYLTNGPSGSNVARFLGLEVNSYTDSSAIAYFASTYGASFPIANNVSPVAINYQLYYTPGYYVIYPDSSYTTICPANCQTTGSSSTIETLLNNAISAWPPAVPGCTDSTAVNYNPLATIDDSSCIYPRPNLFISEYAEGSGYNKYIEIYNGSGIPVDLSAYEIWKVTNGGTWPEYTLSLAGMLAHDDVYIICSSASSVNSIITTAADLTWSQANWTGDDAVGLAKNGLLIDVVGKDGPDPGSGWDVAGVTDATKDHTLVRKCSITQGNTNWSLSAGTDSLSSEWIVLSQNDWSDIGQHTHPCQGTTVYGCTDSSAINYISNATVDDSSCTYCVYGCTGPTSCNYDSTATCDDGSCWGLTGCMDSTASNYN